MSLDLLAVRRDAALLDALARRARPTGIETELDAEMDPVVGLLAALAAEVDEGLLDVAGPETAPLIPEQGGRHARPGTVSPLPLAPPQAGRRHVARAVAAMVVTAAVLSISGVAAAVTGDPLTPYKRVIDVVRGGYDEVITKGLAAPKPTVVPSRTKTVPKTPHTTVPTNVTVAVLAAKARYAAVSPASRDAAGRQLWDRYLGGRKVPARGGRDRHGWGARHRDGSAGAGTARSGDNWYGQYGQYGSFGQYGPSGQHWAGRVGGTGPGYNGQVGGDTGRRWDRSGDPRQ